MISKIIYLIAVKIVDDDWQQVKSVIHSEWKKIIDQPESSPTLLAQKLLVSGEDHRHKRHPGYDSYAICRAIWRRLFNNSREGASTIEQQVVRVITGKFERTLNRKVREILISTLVSRTFHKSILPAIYLQIGYFGWRMNGYSQACKRLNINTSSHSLEEAASLVARLKYPQPQNTPPKRLRQIKNRKSHLIFLYKIHIKDGTYEHLESIPVQKRFAAQRIVGISS